MVRSLFECPFVVLCYFLLSFIKQILSIVRDPHTRPKKTDTILNHLFRVTAYRIISSLGVSPYKAKLIGLYRYAANAVS